MKQTILVFLMLVLLCIVWANPIETVVLSRFWFDSNGDMQLQFSEHLWADSTSVSFFDGSNTYTFPVELSDTTLVIVQAPVQMNPLQGYFQISWQGITNEVSWGQGMENDLSPLTGTECAVHTLISEYDSSYWVWAKDFTPGSGFGHHPLARSTVDLACYDFSGSPVANIPVYYQSTWHPYCSTLENGHAELSLYCSKTRLVVKHPQTQEVVYDSTFFAEPGQTYSADVHFYHVAGEDPIAGIEQGVFTICPTILPGTASQILHLDYSKKIILSGKVELFDIKGRLLATQDYQDGGLDWQLPAKLSSGVYLLRLSTSRGVLGNQKLIILK